MNRFSLGGVPERVEFVLQTEPRSTDIWEDRSWPLFLADRDGKLN